MEWWEDGIQVLIGHGNFKGKLSGLGLSERGECERCGVEESGNHVAFECEEYAEDRAELRERVEGNGGEWCVSEVMKEENREEFFKMVKGILKRKEEKELELETVRGGTLSE